MLVILDWLGRALLLVGGIGLIAILAKREREKWTSVPPAAEPEVTFRPYVDPIAVDESEWPLRLGWGRLPDGTLRLVSYRSPHPLGDSVTRVTLDELMS